jgi:DNA-binding transcriptional MerR regulator
MESLWTLPELVAEVATRIAALPAPKNGQVRAVPDERTIRYYAAIGLLDRPAKMRGRTALYARRHVAQVVAIKRLQTMGRTLAEIQALWPTLDDATLARMSGVALDARPRAPARAGFWKRAPAASEPPEGPHEANALNPGDPDARAHAQHERGGSSVPPARSESSASRAEIELRVELAPGVVLALSAERGIAMSPHDARAIRDAAAPLLAELASRRLVFHPGGEHS